MRRLYKHRIVREYVCEIPEMHVRSASAVMDIFGPLYGDQDKEHFLVVAVNGKNRCVAYEEVSVGSIGASIVNPREAFRFAVMHSAAGVVFVHNHPSGDPSPSAEDKVATARLRRAGEVLGIEVLDHVILARTRYYSFADNDWQEAR